MWCELMLPLEKFISSTNPDYIAGIESRGFITASALAYKMNKGFICQLYDFLARKKTDQLQKGEFVY